MRPFEHEEKVLAFQKAESGKLFSFNCFEDCVIEEKSLCYPAKLCKIKRQYAALI